MKMKCSSCLRGGIISNAVVIFVGQSLCETCFRNAIKLIEEQTKKEQK